MALVNTHFEVTSPLKPTCNVHAQVQRQLFCFHREGDVPIQGSPDEFLTLNSRRTEKGTWNK